MGKMLVVVDYQNDFVNGSLGFEEAVSLEGNIYNKVKANIEQGNTVVFTYDTHYSEYLNSREGRSLPVEHCIDNTEGHKLFGKMKEFNNKEFKNIFHIKKESFGAMQKDFRLGNFDEIEICGVVTNICVISNAIILQTEFKEANIIIDASCTASFDRELHNKALDVMESLQMKIINRN